jgi:hypothetical protein
MVDTEEREEEMEVDELQLTDNPDARGILDDRRKLGRGTNYTVRDLHLEGLTSPRLASLTSPRLFLFVRSSLSRGPTAAAWSPSTMGKVVASRRTPSGRLITCTRSRVRPRAPNG